MGDGGNSNTRHLAYLQLGTDRHHARLALGLWRMAVPEPELAVGKGAPAAGTGMRQCNGRLEQFLKLRFPMGQSTCAISAGRIGGDDERRGSGSRQLVAAQFWVAGDDMSLRARPPHRFKTPRKPLRLGRPRACRALTVCAVNKSMSVTPATSTNASPTLSRFGLSCRNAHRSVPISSPSPATRLQSPDCLSADKDRMRLLTSRAP